MGVDAGRPAVTAAAPISIADYVRQSRAAQGLPPSSPTRPSSRRSQPYWSARLEGKPRVYHCRTPAVRRTYVLGHETGAALRHDQLSQRFLLVLRAPWRLAICRRSDKDAASWAMDASSVSTPAPSETEKRSIVIPGRRIS